jgi:hypothetical protein
MKTRISTGLVALVVFVAAFAAVAAASTTTNGKVASFTYNNSAQAGRLTVSLAKRKLVFQVTTNTNCGVSRGQSGDQIPCKTLGAAKYKGKKVTVTWSHSGSNRVASVVAVHL